MDGKSNINRPVTPGKAPRPEVVILAFDWSISGLGNPDREGAPVQSAGTATVAIHFAGRRRTADNRVQPTKKQPSQPRIFCV